MPTVELDPPTISMTFGVNDSPLAGKDGTHVSHVSFSLFRSLLCLLFFAISFAAFCHWERVIEIL